MYLFQVIMATSIVYGSNCLYFAAIVLDTYNLFILTSSICNSISNKKKKKPTITKNEELLINRVSHRVNCNYFDVNIVHRVYFLF